MPIPDGPDSKDERSAGPSPDAYWERVRSLFHAASALPVEQQDAFLADACAGDEAMREEVLSLLASHDTAGDFPKPERLRGFAEGELVAGRYRIVHFLGAGGMGEVYEVEDRELQEAVALKIIRPSIAASPRVLLRFRREIQLARRVTHPNVCRIYDVARDAVRQISFVSMELLHGRTLSAHLREHGRMAMAEALPIVQQLAAGLDAAHAASIVHRDFKSANVMLVRIGAKSTRAVITDFGLAHETGVAEDAGQSRLTDTGTLIGTADYMAPEQIEDGPITPATDVYALGIVMFEMMTGRLPFAGTTPLSVALSRLQQQAPSPRRWAPDLDARWEAVILRCLERDPAQRYASAGQAAAALDATSPMPKRPKMRDAHRKKRWGSIAAVIVSLLAIVFAFVMQRERTNAPAKPAASTTAGAPAAFKPRRAIAILGFRNLAAGANEAWLSGAFSELLSSELSAAEELRLVPGDDVAQLQSDLALREGDAVGRNALPNIRERLAADVLVTGAFLTVASGDAKQVRLDVRMQDATSGETLGTITESGTEGDLFQLIARTGERLRKELGAAPLSVESTAGLRASYPTNADATRAYVEGLNKMRHFDALGARTSFERAVKLEPEYPMSHSALAEALWTLGSEKQAIEAADRALALSGKLGREERLSIEARANVFHKNFDKAIEICRSLLVFYPDELAYGLRLASVQVSAGKAKDALATIEKLRTLPKPLGDDPALDTIAADAYHLLHENRKELAVAEHAEAVGAASNMRAVVARAKSNQAFAHRDLGNPDRSVALLEEATKLYEEMGDRAGAARCLTNLGLSLWNRGDLNAADVVLGRALVMLRQVGHRSFESRTLNNLGIIRFMKGDLDGAEKMWREAVVVQRESNFLTAMAPTLSNLGGVRQLRGDMAGAEQLYQEAIDVSRQTDDHFGEIIAISNIAEVRRLRGDLAASRQPYEQALAMARKIEMQQSESYILAAMGELALWENDLPEARKRHTAAIGIRRRAKEKISVAQSQVMMANLSLEEGKAADALIPLRDAIAVFAQENAAEDEALGQETQARVFLAQGRIADAEKSLSRARALTKSSRTLGLLGAITATEARVLLAQGRADAAAKRASEAAVLAEKSQILATILETRLVLAAAEAKRGNAAASKTMRAEVAERARAHRLLLIARKAA